MSTPTTATADAVRTARAANLTYAQYRQDVCNIHNYHCTLCRQGRESEAERVAAEYDALERAYPEHARKLAIELCQEDEEAEAALQDYLTTPDPVAF